MAIMSFADALKDSASRSGARHLLLGNGFSIACRPEAFTYGRLFDEANFEALSIDAGPLFELSGTADFERAIKNLRVSAAVLAIYRDASGDLVSQIVGDADALKEALAEVLARRHPENVGSIEDAEYASARQFLSNFDGNIYTVNYDLLLYWTSLQEFEPSIRTDDGFRADPDDLDAEWVVWDGFAAHHQRIYYLHGGLHLYDAGSALKKLTWARTGVPLIDQIQSALAVGNYPLVVTEGSTDEKLARIEHSPYLHRGLKSLNSCRGCLFIHGHSLDANDDHVLSRIERGGFEAAYVSLHGKPGKAPNKAIQNRAHLLAERRSEHEASKPAKRQRMLEVHFYDADSASIWTAS